MGGTPGNSDTDGRRAEGLSDAVPPPPARAVQAPLSIRILPRPQLNRTALALHKLSTFLRARLWGAVLALLSDGVTTLPKTGTPVPLFRRNRLPSGPLVVVSNHHSHADSAALVATLGRDHRPIMFAAAADYWLTSRIRHVAGETLIGLWPVRRSETGRRDLLEAAAAIQAGVVLVVYPEGTRRADSSPGTFKTGAFEAAKAANATILPVATVGTEKLLGKGGKYRRRPVEVRWADPIPADQVQARDASDLAQEAQQRVRSLTEEPVRQRPGFGYARASRIAASWLGLAIVFFWAFGEGISWPLIAEMPLLLLVVTCGWSWRAPLLIATSAVGSILGIMATWWLVTHGFDPPTPLTTQRMAEEAMAHMQANPATAFWYQMFNGIPVKVYANAAGNLDLPFGTLLQVVFPRALRIVLVGGTAWALSAVLARYLKPCLGMIQVYALAVFPFALAAVVGYWS